jgi:hypothetical protein
VPLTNVTDTSGDLHIWPAALPNGKGVLFALCAGGVPPCRLAVVDLKSRQVTDLKIGGTQPTYSSTGQSASVFDRTVSLNYR